MRTLLRAVSSLILLFSISVEAAVDVKHSSSIPSEFDDASALKYSQAALGNQVGDYSFRDRKGRSVKLSSFHGKPLVISLIYTSCYHTCPMITSHLARVVDIAREALGHDSFAVATIGFDTRVDNPERMRMYARERGIDVSDWWFLSTDAATIDQLVQDIGFIFFASPKGFDHLSQTTVLDAQGRVYRQVYGELLNPPSLVEPLKELVFGLEASGTSVSGWLKGLRLFCTIYDPNSGRYRFDYSIFISAIIGTLSLGAVGVFIIRAWRQSKPPGKVA